MASRIWPTDQSSSITHVAEQAGAALVSELVGDRERHVHHRVRHVEKERLILVAVDEADRVLGVERRELGEFFGIDGRVDDFVAFEQRQRRRFAFAARPLRATVLIISACSGDMSFEYGRPKYSSKPCCSGRNCLWWPRCHLP